MVRSSRSTLLALLLGMALATIAASAADAQELVTPKVKDRHFPSNTFCPIPFDVTFTADGPNALIRFSTNVFFTDHNNGDQIAWSHQYLDNICVAPEAVYTANLVDPGSYSSGCYSDEPILKRFAFQSAGTIPVKELFDSNPAPRGWDLSHGAYWQSTPTGPNDPGVENDFSNSGALGLGQDSTTPSLSDSAYTSIIVDGLQSGHNYVVTGWWVVQNINMNLGEIFLVERIYGTAVAPIVRRTWGALKAQYR